jgi:hypothetical protein
MAVCHIEHIIGAISWACHAVSLCVEDKGRSYIADNAVILGWRHPQHLAARRDLRIEQVIDMHQYIIRSEHRTGNIGTADICPGFAVPIYAAMPPADHCMRAIKCRLAQLVGSDQVA